ncbi:hypothetical protein L2E82_13027 [Cichorium intybus]|uniref:Uncharacterized protein n=1 Tax=Cichorium intybus TaxID=13427 RepID=A0ACB9GIY9_CICIN|nr:hypothetical protein L2E82_13027 [Cichorium intybus]
MYIAYAVAVAIHCLCCHRRSDPQPSLPSRSIASISVGVPYQNLMLGVLYQKIVSAMVVVDPRKLERRRLMEKEHQWRPTIFIGD